MKTILILDTETSDKDPAKGALLEVATASFDVEAGKLLEAQSRLVCLRDIENAAEHINGIPSSLLWHGWEPHQVDAWLFAEAQRHDAIVAHNADFDRQWVPDLRKPWICSCDDVEWPRNAGSKSLVSLALAHGVGVVYAHRALADVLTLAHMLERVAEMGVDLERLLERAMRPKALFQALVSYDDREKAKEAGFRWEPEKKRWVRKVFLEDVPALGFKVLEVQP